jgi:hypothetical protein
MFSMMLTAWLWLREFKPPPLPKTPPTVSVFPGETPRDVSRTPTTKKNR